MNCDRQNFHGGESDNNTDCDGVGSVAGRRRCGKNGHYTFIQLMGCGGAVNRLLVDRIEEGIVQNLEEEETANAQRRNEVLI
jgi:hypothetical protein